MMRDLSLREISPDLADILETAAHVNADPSGIEAFTSEWLIDETMLNDPTLTRDQAIAEIHRAAIEAAEGGL